MLVKEVKKPVFIPKKRLKGSAAGGMAFERSLKKGLSKKARNGIWLEIDGKKWKCIDWILEEDVVYLIECKLKDIEEGVLQVRNYMRYVKELYKKEIIPIVVVKYLTAVGKGDFICYSLKDARDFYELTGRIPVIHWIGNGKL